MDLEYLSPRIVSSLDYCLPILKHPISSKHIKNISAFNYLSTKLLKLAAMKNALTLINCPCLTFLSLTVYPNLYSYTLVYQTTRPVPYLYSFTLAYQTTRSVPICFPSLWRIRPLDLFQFVFLHSGVSEHKTCSLAILDSCSCNLLCNIFTPTSYGPHQAKMCHWVMCRQRRHAQSDQGLHCPLTESLDTTESMNGQQRRG